MEISINDRINYRQLAENIEKIHGGWSDCSFNNEMYKKFVSKLETDEAQEEIIGATEKLILKIEKKEGITGLHSDYPTFIFWVLSLMFVSRTLDILKDKGSNEERKLKNGEKNLLGFQRAYEIYCKELESIIDRY